MGKYVGKIFRVPNSHLGLKKRGTHYVHVKWFNPFNFKFRCKIITSLEDKKEIPKENKGVLNNIPYYDEGNNIYNIFSRNKYLDLREGKIIPISSKNLEGFNVWSGYYGQKDLYISSLKGREQRHLKIKK